jgi:hypothetical protein
VKIKKDGLNMDIMTLIAVLIPSVLSSIISIISIYLSYKKAKEPKPDEIWETTVRIMCNSKEEQIDYADKFSEIYEELTIFKKLNCKVPHQSSLSLLRLSGKTGSDENR